MASGRQRPVQLIRISIGDEIADRAALALESRERLQIACELRREDLDGDLAPETSIAGAIDLAHPAAAEETENFVRAEPRTGTKLHAGDYKGSAQCSVVPPASPQPTAPRCPVASGFSRKAAV